MANNVTMTPQLTLLGVENTTQNVLINRSIAPSLDAITAKAVSYLLEGVGLVSVTPEITPFYLVYVRNLHATNAVLVELTPVGGALVAVVNLGPGGFLMITDTALTAAPAVGGISRGFSAMSVQASGASTPIEYAVAG